MPQPAWIVIANGSRARLLQRDAPGEPLFEVMDWVHPETRHHAGPSDSRHRHSGTGGRAGLSPRMGDKDRARATFAQQICQWLVKEVDARQIGSLSLFASNPFLGELTAHGQGQLQRLIRHTHPVDLTHLSLTALNHRLQNENFH